MEHGRFVGNEGNPFFRISHRIGMRKSLPHVLGHVAVVGVANKIRLIASRYSIVPKDVTAQQKNFGEFTDQNTPATIIKFSKLLHRYGLLRTMPRPENWIYGAK